MHHYSRGRDVTLLMENVNLIIFLTFNSSIHLSRMNTNHFFSEREWWEDWHPALHVPRGGCEEALRQACRRLVHRGPPTYPPLRHSPLSRHQGGTLPDHLRGQVVPEPLPLAVHQRPRQGFGKLFIFKSKSELR